MDSFKVPSNMIHTYFSIYTNFFFSRPIFNCYIDMSFENYIVLKNFEPFHNEWTIKVKVILGEIVKTYSKRSTSSVEVYSDWWRGIYTFIYLSISKWAFSPFYPYFFLEFLFCTFALFLLILFFLFTKIVFYCSLHKCSIKPHIPSLLKPFKNN